MFKVLNAMIHYFGTDVRRINHALKVYGFASAICRSEGLSQEMIDCIEMSAILHDIGIPVSEKKYGSCIGKYQELEGPPIAKDILLSLHVPVESIERICYIIGNHHTYHKVDGLDFQILVEADFLVNIYEDEMSVEMIESIKRKYIKTPAAVAIINSLYQLE